MKKLLFFTLMLIMLSVQLLTAQDGKLYGEKLTLKETVAVSAIMEDPESYLGQDVLIEGLVVDVCSKRGCWMEISSDKEYEKIKVKVDDGVIVFPMSAKGHSALVQGKVYKISMSEEQVHAWLKHEAEEHGHKYDPSEVTGPRIMYQIKGHGAVIK